MSTSKSEACSDTEAAVPAYAGRPRGTSIQKIMSHYGGVVVVVLLLILFSALLPHTFFTSNTVSALLSSMPVDLCIALAALVPLVAGEFDLSIGYMLGISDALVSYLSVYHHVPLLLCLLAALVAGTLIGLVNGILVTVVRIDSFIATLASGFVLSGVILAITGGNIVTLTTQALTKGTFDGVGFVPYALIYTLAGAALLFYLIDHTPFGRYLRATGSNKDAARLSGLDTGRLKLWAFVIGGLLAAAAGILNLGQVGSTDPTVGPEFILPAFAAVFLGATMFRPGSFNVQGLIVGSFLLVIGVTGLGELGAPSWFEPVFDGGVLIVAVGYSYRAQSRS
jgi:ribose transport system permease protein